MVARGIIDDTSSDRLCNMIKPVRQIALYAIEMNNLYDVFTKI